MSWPSSKPVGALGTEPNSQRFALLIGANDGGEGRETLRYAVSDARSVHRVLTELGGTATPDALLLVQPTRDTLERTLSELGERLSGASTRGLHTELFFYYSGHSDDDGMLLGGSR